MFNHEPAEYDCPFCRLASGGEHHLTSQDDQDAWNYHVHDFPRYPGDNLYNTTHLADPATAEERQPYVRRLRAHLTSAS